MVGVIYACSLENPETIQLSREHSEARWVTAEEAAELLSEDRWLVELIQRAETMRALISDELMASYRLVEGSSPVSNFAQLYRCRFESITQFFTDIFVLAH